MTLARKVESELARAHSSLKGAVVVGVHDGIAELRGQLPAPELIAAFAATAGRVDGVTRVENLLHTPGAPPKHSPPSDPDEVRARAQAGGPDEEA